MVVLDVREDGRFGCSSPCELDVHSLDAVLQIELIDENERAWVCDFTGANIEPLLILPSALNRSILSRIDGYKGSLFDVFPAIEFRDVSPETDISYENEAMLISC